MHLCKCLRICQKASLFAPWCTSNQLNLTSFPTQPPSPRAPAPCSPQPVPSHPAAANIDRSRVPKPHCRRDPQTSTRCWVVAAQRNGWRPKGGGWFVFTKMFGPYKIIFKKNLFETTTYTVLILSYLWNLPKASHSKMLSRGAAERALCPWDCTLVMGVEANLCIAHASAYAGWNYIHVDMYIFIKYL